MNKQRAEKKSFEIGVNAEWLKEQQHQIKYETVLFLQGKIVQLMILQYYGRILEAETAT